MRWVLWFAVVVVLTGATLLGYARQLPVYTAPDARDLVSQEAESVPMEERSDFWFRRLSEFETPHKRLLDLGHGIAANGLGILSVCGLVAAYCRFSFVRTRWALFLLWCGAWAIRAPAAVYYYTYRQARGDYPWWSDAIMIPIAGEFLFAVVGGLISLVVAGMLLGNRRLPDSLERLWPPLPDRRVRSWLILIWGGLLAVLTLLVIPEGDLGTILSCSVGLFVVAVVLAAQRESAEPPREHQ